MHVGYRNNNFNYHLGETQLKSVESEKDLIIIIIIVIIQIFIGTKQNT